MENFRNEWWRASPTVSALAVIELIRDKRNFHKATYVYNIRLRGALNMNVMLTSELTTSYEKT